MSSLGLGFCVSVWAFFPHPTNHHPLRVFFPFTSLFFTRPPVGKCAQSTKLLSTHLDIWKVLCETWLGWCFSKWVPQATHVSLMMRCLLITVPGGS